MDYSKTKVYKIYSHLGDKIYIGSTTNNYLCNRMAKHRTGYTYWKKHNKQYLTSFILFDEYGIENCIIELIEAKECINKDEKNKLEGHYIKALECVNKNIMGQSKQESNKNYFNKNKEKLLKERNERYENNKEKASEQCKEYREAHKEELKIKSKEYRESHKEELKLKKKEYRESHKEELKLKKKIYYDANKDAINMKKKEYRNIQKLNKGPVG